MNSRRVYFGLLGIIVLLFVGLVFGTYSVNKLLATRANKLTSLKAKNLALQQEQITFLKAKKDIQTYEPLQKIAKSVVPQDKNQAEAVREIVGIADTYGINLATISFPASNLGATSGSTVAASPSTTTPSTPAAGNNKAGALSQLLPLKNIAGVYQLPITVQADANQPVPYDKFVSFLRALEHNRRTAQVSTITIQPQPTNRNLLTFSLTLNEYIKP